MSYKDTTSFYPYPEHTIPLEQKDKNWHLQWCQAIYGNFMGAGSKFWLFSAKPEYARLRAYANGKQDQNQYRKQLDCIDENHNSLINKNFRWDIVPFLPKFRNIVVSKVLKNGFQVVLNRFDSLGISEKREFKAKLEAQIQMTEFIEFVKQNLGVDLREQGQDMPIDMDEVESYMETEYKDNLSMAFETALTLELNWNNFDLIRKMMIQDWVDVGVGGCKTGTLRNGKPYIRYIKPDNLVVSIVQKEDFSDLTHVGEMRLLTLNELLYEAGDSLSKSEIEKLKNQFGNRRDDVPTNYISEDGLSVRHEFRIPVIDCEWYSVQAEGYSPIDDSDNGTTVYPFKAEKNDRRGETKANEQDRKGKKSKIEKNEPKGGLGEYETSENEDEESEVEDSEDENEMEMPKSKSKPKENESENKENEDESEENEQRTYRTIHKGTYVLGTNIIYDWGLRNDMVRTFDDPSETRLSYHLYAPSMNHGDITSLIKQLVPLADILQITWLRLQQALTQMNPYQVAIDIDAITGLSIDFGGGAIKPKEVLDLFFKKGILAYSGEIIRQNPNAKPIYELPARGSEVAMTFFNLIQGFTNLIREVSGINGVTDASTPQTDMLVGVQQQAIAATNDALQHLYHADMEVLVNMAKDMVERIADNIRYFDGYRYKEAIGEQTVKFLQDNSDKALPVFGIMAEKKITEEQRQEINIMAQNAMQNQLIDFEDYFAISNCKTIKQAQRLLTIRTRRKQRKMEQMQQQQMQMNAQVQTEAAQNAAQIKMQEAQALLEIEIQKAQALLDVKLKEMAVMQQNAIELALIQRETELIKIKTKGQIDEVLLEQEAENDLINQDLKSKYEIEKQKLANSKPQPKTKP